VEAPSLLPFHGVHGHLCPKTNPQSLCTSAHPPVAQIHRHSDTLKALVSGEIWWNLQGLTGAANCQTAICKQLPKGCRECSEPTCIVGETWFCKEAAPIIKLQSSKPGHYGVIPTVINIEMAQRQAKFAKKFIQVPQSTLDFSDFIIYLCKIKKTKIATSEL
jgi:hypothetical protein